MCKAVSSPVWAEVAVCYAWNKDYESYLPVGIIRRTMEATETKRNGIAMTHGRESCSRPLWRKPGCDFAVIANSQFKGKARLCYLYELRHFTWLECTRYLWELCSVRVLYRYQWPKMSYMTVLWVVLRNTEKVRGNRSVCEKMENITTGSMQVTDLKKIWGTRLYISNY